MSLENKKAGTKKPDKDKKKKDKPLQQTRSHIKNGKAYYQHVGGYYEVTRDAIGKFPGSSVGD